MACNPCPQIHGVKYLAAGLCTSIHCEGGDPADINISTENEISSWQLQYNKSSELWEY